MEAEQATETLGAFLKRRRLDLGLTQEELAERAQMSERSIRDLEHGVHRIPYRDTVQRLADALALRADEREALEAMARGMTHDPAIGHQVEELYPPSRVRPLFATRHNNLPHQLTPFIGRAQELADVSAIVRQENVRLLTLTGPGGTGKTRLALEVAAALLDEFERGVLFVPLASTADPALVPSTIAAALHLQEAGGHALEEVLLGFLRSKQMLLVLDNVEHLLDAGLWLADLLVRCPRVTVLVTSRSVLHLSGEHTFSVPPLSLPALATLPAPDRLRTFDAVALFLERALAVQPEFVLTNDNALDVATICHRLDGLPLAIELAAARLRVFSPHALLTLLDHPLEILTGGPHDAPLRLQTLQATIDWSYQLLDPGEQLLFERLAVFQGGCTLDSLEVVCNPEGDLGILVLDAVTSLSEKSSLLHRTDSDGGLRLFLLTTLREYALRRLETRGELEAVRARYAGHYLDLARQAETELMGPKQREWLRRLDDEQDNLRAVLRWMLDRGDVEQALQLAIAITPFWRTQGHLTEGRAWIEEGLARSEAVTESIRAEGLLAIGQIAMFQGDNRGAIEALETSLALFRSLGDKRGTAYALAELGNVLSNMSDDVSGGHLEESLALFHEVDDGQGVALVLRWLGNSAAERGERERALSLLAESVTLAKELGNQQARAIGLQDTGAVRLKDGEYHQAALLFRDALSLLWEIGDTFHVLDSIEFLAVAVACAPSGARAVSWLAAVETTREVMGAPLQPAQQVLRDGCHDIARTRIDEETWERAWQEGRAMPLDQAISEALAFVKVAAP